MAGERRDSRREREREIEGMEGERGGLRRRSINDFLNIIKSQDDLNKMFHVKILQDFLEIPVRHWYVIGNNYLFRYCHNNYRVN